MNNQKTVLVTGIGGVVGQGIVRNIRKADPTVKIIGTNISSFSAGSHLVDTFELVPYAYETTYISRMVEIISTHHVDLVLPSTDYETFYLAESEERLPCNLVTAKAETAQMYLDKYLSAEHHKKHHIPFAQSMLPSQYNNEFEEVVVKPRCGRGSRNIYFNPEQVSAFNDEEYVVQERLVGPEVTTAFYVDKEGGLHGFITLERELQHGATNECRVVTRYDDQIKKILLAMVQNASFRGSANVQSIVTKSGEIVPFEINCRISGTNSIRTHFGFEDVKYSLQEYLWNQAPEKPLIKKGVAVRILLDVIYPEQEEYKHITDKGTKHYVS